ncbi:DUF5693 family protein [Oceanithermus sp.]|uniref:DUF5693 family protein n=1 Tax=Oceanithermus sp. TaxID=2268145 RepID=UPI00257BD92B|nr:DUF5693 family protein [Oceanithermus sp.]
MKKLLHLLLLLALLPSLAALYARWQVERPGPVVLTLDGQAVREEARLRGLDLDALLDRYRDLGVRGLGVYELRTQDWVERGKALYADGNLLRLIHPGGGFEPGWFYLSPRDPEELERIAKAWTLPQHRVAWLDRVWIGFPKDVLTMPLGPDRGFILERYRKGNYIVYRPYNDRLRSWPPPLPEPVQAVVFAGEEVLGYPDRLSRTAELVTAPVGFVEGAQQKGLLQIARDHPTLRVFSLPADWQLKLSPEAAAEKYLLAARERGHQILYFRPWPDPEKTERFIERVEQGLAASGIALGEPLPRTLEPPAYARLAWVGVLAGLGLLALAFPQPLGLLLALGLLLGGFVYAGAAAGPLLAALVFASLGFVRYRRGLTAWLAALGYALVGAVYLAALGSNTQTITGLVPFKGVLLTLAVPPLLVALAGWPKDRDLRRLIAEAWEHRVRLGEVALALAAVVALAVVLLRRGNTEWVPGLELQLRALLQDWMVRPRFKEIFGHAVAVLALTQPWPRWVHAGLLAFAALAEASILNTFSHYHSPLFVSLARTLNGAVVGLVLGLALAAGVWAVRRWWSR